MQKDKICVGFQKRETSELIKWKVWECQNWRTELSLQFCCWHPEIVARPFLETQWEKLAWLKTFPPHQAPQLAQRSSATNNMGVPKCRNYKSPAKTKSCQRGWHSSQATSHWGRAKKFKTCRIHLQTRSRTAAKRHVGIHICRDTYHHRRVRPFSLRGCKSNRAGETVSESRISECISHQRNPALYTPVLSV